jgi:hypothetical protein
MKFSGKAFANDSSGVPAPCSTSTMVRFSFQAVVSTAFLLSQLSVVVATYCEPVPANARGLDANGGGAFLFGDDYPVPSGGYSCPTGSTWCAFANRDHFVVRSNFVNGGLGTGSGTCWANDGQGAPVQFTYKFYQGTTGDSNQFSGVLVDLDLSGGWNIAQAFTASNPTNGGGTQWIRFPTPAANINAADKGLGFFGTNDCQSSTLFPVHILKFCVVPPSPRPPTRSPVKPPTPAPAKKPTCGPTKAPAKPPTKAPVKPPTKAPVKPPTMSPVKPPSMSPVYIPSPTKAPVKAPTGTPVKPPTKAPVQTPIKSPTKAFGDP